MARRRRVLWLAALAALATVVVLVGRRRPRAASGDGVPGLAQIGLAYAGAPRASAYAWDMHDVCLTPVRDDSDGGGGVSRKRDWTLTVLDDDVGAEDAAPVPMRTVTTYAGEPTPLGRAVRAVHVRARQPVDAAACWHRGLTLLTDDDNHGADVRGPGFLGSAVRWFALPIALRTGQSPVARLWSLAATPLPEGAPLLPSWEQGWVQAALGVDAAHVPPLMAASRGDGACETVCFERAVLPSAEHALLYGSAHADHVRARLYAHCDIVPSPAVAKDRWTLVFALDPSVDRLYRPGALLLEARRHGAIMLEPPPTAGGATDVCDHVRTFARADVVVGVAGLPLLSTLMLRPGSVVIELVREGRHWPFYKTLADHARLHYLELPATAAADATLVLDVTAWGQYLTYARTLHGRAGHPLAACMRRPDPPTHPWPELNPAWCTPPPT
jgi:hypothetical protein